MPQTEGALADVRVLDLTQRIAGPFCTKLLADFGASVLKVERPGGGDVARHMAPFLDDTPGLERSGLFAYLNTNKRSITLNLKDPTGLRLMQQLVQDVDVIVESFAPRVMPSLGLDFASLQAMKSDIILVSIANFGQTGPYRDWRLRR
jgi:crotonobetainyl-CoA:carnitine CoA-transferase CaiB-like acyl-CoA transferase